MSALAWGIDAASDVSIDVLKAQGASFICCYLAPYPSQAWKIRTPANIHDYLNAGIRVVANWESDGTPGNGWQTGVDAANTAQAELNDRGIPEAVVYFTFADSGNPDLPTLLQAHLGAASVLGLGRCGGYGGVDVIRFLFDNNAITYGWQTYGWSNNQWEPRAQLRQWKNTNTLDFDEAWAEDFGQWPRPASSDPASSAPPAQPPTPQRRTTGVHDMPTGEWSAQLGQDGKPIGGYTPHDVVFPCGPDNSQLCSSGWFSLATMGSGDAPGGPAAEGAAGHIWFTGTTPDGSAAVWLHDEEFTLTKAVRRWWTCPPNTDQIHVNFTAQSNEPVAWCLELAPK